MPTKSTIVLSTAAIVISFTSIALNCHTTSLIQERSGRRGSDENWDENWSAMERAFDANLDAVNDFIELDPDDNPWIIIEAIGEWERPKEGES